MERTASMARGSRLSLATRWAACAVLTWVAGCERPAAPVPNAAATGEWRTFEGSWSATGTRQFVDLGPDRRVSTFRLTGSLLLSGEKRLGVGFRAQVMGLSDPRTGMVGRCVWTDERGDQIYSELKGDAVGSGTRIEGTIVGGSGRYTGVTGDYTFRWQSVVDSENDEVSGRVVDLKGRVRTGLVAQAGKVNP
ncbi:hypothetical protein DSM104443_01519 [Usitatibacter rugosus]|uniref:Uncharacterized protein n=2 Tax=Usitatibacter rugosus TaxID=2732067 RepID=A0A6M4GTZ0_9PROT|nr:hypothetical protein DSM104443_01519 [Usitatibacter rugosus]